MTLPSYNIQYGFGSDGIYDLLRAMLAALSMPPRIWAKACTATAKTSPGKTACANCIAALWRPNLRQRSARSGRILRRSPLVNFPLWVDLG
ncbi:hypothetical protein [Cypionkella sp.]|uniref:hypothetical protein n=1 Tax=Cypionkella sp. TaxID=2811411 RepID=UPI0037511CE0